MFKVRRSKVIEFCITVCSLSAVAALNYAIIHNTFIFVVLAVLLAHELGHYIVATLYKLKPKLPVFLPFPFFLIAATKIPQTTREATRQIALAGPVAGCFACLFFLLTAVSLGLSRITLFSILVLFLSEAVFNFFGSDGKKFRAA